MGLCGTENTIFSLMLINMNISDFVIHLND